MVNLDNVKESSYIVLREPFEFGLDEYPIDLFTKFEVGNIEIFFGLPIVFPYLKGVFIKVNEKTTKKDITNPDVWGMIQDFRDEYYKNHGYSLFDHEIDIEAVRFYKWLQLKGIGPRKLTTFLNFEASVYLVQKTQSEFPKWKKEGEKNLKKLFKTLNWESEYKRLVTYGGEEDIKVDNAPWNIYKAPFPEEKLINKVDYLEDLINSGKRNFGPFISGYDLYFTQAPLEPLGYYDDEVDFIGDTRNLLNDTYPDMWRLKEKHIDEVFDKLDRAKNKALVRYSEKSRS